MMGEVKRRKNDEVRSDVVKKNETTKKEGETMGLTEQQREEVRQIVNEVVVAELAKNNANLLTELKKMFGQQETGQQQKKSGNDPVLRAIRSMRDEARDNRATGDDQPEDHVSLGYAFRIWAPALTPEEVREVLLNTVVEALKECTIVENEDSDGWKYYEFDGLRHRLELALYRKIAEKNPKLIEKRLK